MYNWLESHPALKLWPWVRRRLKERRSAHPSPPNPLFPPSLVGADMPSSIPRQHMHTSAEGSPPPYTNSFLCRLPSWAVNLLVYSGKSGFAHQVRSPQSYGTLGQPPRFSETFVSSSVMSLPQSGCCVDRMSFYKMLGPNVFLHSPCNSQPFAQERTDNTLVKIHLCLYPVLLRHRVDGQGNFFS